MLRVPQELQDPLLNMTGADVNSEASILAALPFDVFHETVVADLVLEDESQPALFQTGRSTSY